MTKSDSSMPSLGCFLVLPFLGVGAVATLIVGSIGFSTFMSISGRNQAAAESSLAQYVSGTVYEARTCRNRDTDNNGYISCDVLDTETKRIETVECAAPFTFNSGCRTPKLLTAPTIGR